MDSPERAQLAPRTDSNPSWKESPIKQLRLLFPKPSYVEPASSLTGLTKLAKLYLGKTSVPVPESLHQAPLRKSAKGTPLGRQPPHRAHGPASTVPAGFHTRPTACPTASSFAGPSLYTQQFCVSLFICCFHFNSTDNIAPIHFFKLNICTFQQYLDNIP